MDMQLWIRYVSVLFIATTPPTFFLVLSQGNCRQGQSDRWDAEQVHHLVQGMYVCIYILCVTTSGIWLISREQMAPLIVCLCVLSLYCGHLVLETENTSYVLQVVYWHWFVWVQRILVLWMVCGFWCGWTGYSRALPSPHVNLNDNFANIEIMLLESDPLPNDIHVYDSSCGMWGMNQVWS